MDWGSALVVVAGVCGFAITKGAGGAGDMTQTSVPGISLLALYLSFDAFQSQWQSGLFRTQKVTQLEMMRGVNFFASLLVQYP